ncbi:hypothetical protein ACOSP7_032560 [Xanthoceras sorbifolium]|uniref:C2 domain-containing protein n=1 Tax=Xanthoceras sorbifolium TaxID=99658 RepID=A0ABQ8H478_9ROSI|nr:hypothetical protein JRO89_XS14G0068200 [Xanthoceras sorbifolium]
MATGLMEVQLVGAKGLKDTDFLGKSDPYVVIQYKTQQRKSSVVRGQGKNPTWNEKFTFKVDYPGSGAPYKIILNIMDKDTFSKDDFLGQATIYVEDLLARGVEKATAELPPLKYRVVAADKTYRGEIQVGVTFTRKVEKNATEGEAVGGWKQSGF